MKYLGVKTDMLNVLITIIRMRSFMIYFFARSTAFKHDQSKSYFSFSNWWFYCEKYLLVEKWLGNKGSTKIESPRCSYRLSQLISDPIDLLQNFSSLVCTLGYILIGIIILIFKTQFKNRVPTTLSTVSVGLQICRFIIHQ